MTEPTLPVSPYKKPLLDWPFWLIVAANLLVGTGLWLVMPHGFAATPAASLWSIISFVLLWPAVEELLFRGVMQRELLRVAALSKGYAGISGANLVASILFAALHLVNHPPLWAAAVLVPSLALGYTLERYQRLLVPMLLHSLFNATWLVAGNL